jgi:pyruvate/2-oxoglutarate dehydrogenase complex dihydrolipoamide acyltransferase (E2) component
MAVLLGMNAEGRTMKKVSASAKIPSRAKTPAKLATTASKPAAAAKPEAPPITAPPPAKQPAAPLKGPAKDGEPRQVAFEHFSPDAGEIFLVGSFNNWDLTATPLKKGPGGRWTTKLVLKPGHYEYRFVVDGRWQDDPTAARFVANPFGELNCIIEVESPEK